MWPLVGEIKDLDEVSSLRGMHPEPGEGGGFLAIFSSVGDFQTICWKFNEDNNAVG